MDAMQGNEGATGNSATVDSPHLSTFGLFGEGTISIGTHDEPANETWMWHPRAVRYASDPGTNSHGLPESIWSEWGRTKSMHSSARSAQTSTGLTGPTQFLRTLVDHWKLNPMDAVSLLGFDPLDASHVADVLDDRGMIRGRDAKDRIAHLISIRATLWSLFRDLGVENDWLREPHAALDDEPPLSLLLGGSMEDLLLVREYVDAAAGR